MMRLGLGLWLGTKAGPSGPAPFDGNFGAITPGVSLYLRGDLGLSLTGAVVNQWANQAGAATNMVEKTAAAGCGNTGTGVGGRAAVVTNGLTQAGTYTLACAAPGTTPTFYYLISKQSRTSLPGQPQRVLGFSSSNDLLLYQDATSDTLRQYGTSGFQDVGAPITHVWARTAVLFSGSVSDRIKWGNRALVTGVSCQVAVPGTTTHLFCHDVGSNTYNQGEFGLILNATGVTPANWTASLATLDAAVDSWFGAGNILM
jgi:hypothetical protein